MDLKWEPGGVALGPGGLPQQVAGLEELVQNIRLRLCLSRGVKSLRADTDFPNERMQHVLEKNGFEKRGVVVFQGSGKLAYDKTLA